MDKTESPEVTISNTKKALKKAGLEVDLTDITNHYFLEIPAYTCDLVKGNFHGPVGGGSRSWGKGLTEEEVKVSTLMEFIERRTGNLYFIDKENTIQSSETVFDSYVNIKEKKLPLDPLIYHSEAKEDYKKLRSLISKSKMRYTKYYSLNEEKWKFLPDKWHLFFHGTNGLAAGNTLEEVLLQAMYEVIERHNTAKTLEIPVKRLDINDKGMEILQDVMRKFSRKGIKVSLFDITTDIKIPTIYCAFLDENEKGQLRYAQGWGTILNEIEKCVLKLQKRDMRFYLRI